jgi:hypothetical protein
VSGQGHRPARCYYGCGRTVTWQRRLPADYPIREGYACECGWLAGEDVVRGLGADLETVDGRIRSADDVPPRLALCAQSAADNPYLNVFDRQVYALYLEIATLHSSVEIIASDYWVAERLDAPRARVRRSRAKMEHFKHVKRLAPKEVRMYSVQEQLARRRAEGKKLPIVLEIRKGPDGWPVCAECGGSIPDIQRVSKKYCSDRCRNVSFRKRGIDWDTHIAGILGPLRA